jgi:hypothetical protein
MTERQREALMLLARLQMQDHDRAVCANALFSAEHWKHNAGNDWPDVDDGSFTAFENCVHPDCALVRTALLQAQESQPAQVAQPSNHPACVAGPADAGSHAFMRQMAANVMNGQCDKNAEQFADCDFCTSAVALAYAVEAMLAASASAPAAPRETKS